HTWSLAVEEHFYFVLPFVLLLLHRTRRLKWIPAISIALAVLCFGLRIAYCMKTGFLNVFSDIRADGLFAGVALGYVFHYQRERFNELSRWFVLPLGLVFLLPAFLGFPSGPFSVSVTLGANMIGYSLILAWAVTRKLRVTGAIA